MFGPSEEILPQEGQFSFITIARHKACIFVFIYFLHKFHGLGKITLRHGCIFFMLLKGHLTQKGWPSITVPQFRKETE